MGDEIFSVYLTPADYSKLAYAKLDLPASPWKLLDALDKVRLPEGDSLYLEITDYRDFEVLRSSLVCSATNLLELNDLAERLSRLNEVQRIAFEGLVRVDFQKQESITLKRLRDLAESVDCCHVVESVVSDGQLGRFYAENGFVPEVEGMSDAAFELLDFEKVGKMARMGECGVYVPSGISGLGGYVVQHSDLKSAPEITLNQPVEPAYTIHLRLTAHHDNLPFAGTDVVDLKLPAEDNALEMAVRCLGYVDWGAVECTCLDCKVPQLAEHITNAAPFETIERLGDVLAQMSAAALPAYKALMTATHCQSIVDALDLAEQLDEYILSPSIASPEDAAAEELAFILPEKAAKMDASTGFWRRPSPRNCPRFPDGTQGRSVFTDDTLRLCFSDGGAGGKPARRTRHKVAPRYGGCFYGGFCRRDPHTDGQVGKPAEWCVVSPDGIP